MKQKLLNLVTTINMHVVDNILRKRVIKQNLSKIQDKEVN